VSFLRRILGGGAESPEDAAPATPVTAAAAAEAEQTRERELLLEEARRLDDDLIQRQLRYADRAWTPPAQGGTRRADDAEGAAKG
jgi:hypothetical protein